MSCFRGSLRALTAALGLSLLLLADGFAVVPGHAVAAQDDATGTDPVADEAPVACVAGFDQVDTRVGMSLHGVTLLDRGAMAVGYARRQDDDEFGRRTPATLLNDGRGWSRIVTGSPGDEDGLMAVVTREDSGTWAVGWTTIRGQIMPLAMRWTGKSWKTDRPMPRGSLDAMFTDVTIVGDGSPFAVGYRMTANGKRQPLVIRRDGPRWRTIPINTGKRESVTLTGVTPDRRGGTWVVGHGGPGAEIRPVIYRASGRRLEAPQGPAPAGRGRAHRRGGRRRPRELGRGLPPPRRPLRPARAALERQEVAPGRAHPASPRPTYC